MNSMQFNFANDIVVDAVLLMIPTPAPMVKIIVRIFGLQCNTNVTTYLLVFSSLSRALSAYTYGHVHTHTVNIVSLILFHTPVIKGHKKIGEVAFTVQGRPIVRYAIRPQSSLEAMPEYLSGKGCSEIF